MTAGPVNRALLESNYQSPGQVYDDSKTEGAFDVLADQIDENWGYLSGLVGSGTLTPYPYAKNRQAIINGGFELWDDGTSIAISSPVNKYTANRWIITNNGTGQTGTVSQTVFPTGFTDVPGYSSYYFRYAVTVAATGQTFNAVSQSIESVRTFSGGKATVTFYARADASRNMTIDMRQNFGSGGSASVDVSGGTIALTTSFQRFTITYDLPSITGKTIGTNDCLALLMYCPINSTFTIDISNVTINEGDASLLYAPNQPGVDRILANRYSVRYGGSSFTTFGVGMAVSTTQAYVMVSLPEKLRTIPTAVASGNFKLAMGATNISITSLSKDANQSNTYSEVIVATVAGGLTIGAVVELQANNDATAFIKFDAEY